MRHNMVTIDCISDLHGDEPKLGGGDILIVAGDCTGRDTLPDWHRFTSWLKKQDYEHKILVAGNHDGIFEQGEVNSLNLSGITYLQDTACVACGLSIYGSPWTPQFFDWHFMLPRGEALKAKWDMIPEGLDILVTHGPPYGILDRVVGKMHKPEKAGCEELLKAIVRTEPKHHVFGHVHEHGGKQFVGEHTIYHNVSIMNELYMMVRGATRIEI